MSLTPKILRLIVHATGAITTYGETGEELGYHLESGVTEIRFFLPSTVLGLHHHIYVKQPDGTILISPVLTENTNDEILQGAYVKVDVGDPITSQVGRVKLEYVGNDANENRVFLSASKNMDVDESIYGEYCASENGSWDSEWQKDIDDLEQRVVEAEQKVDEAKAEAEAATSTAEGAVATANAAVASAGQANTKADGAVSTANQAKSEASSAVSTAGQASTKADTAISTANQAKSIAEGIDSKATQALTQSGQAVSTANGAVTTANAANATAGQANTKADTAIGTANAASTAAAGAVATASQTKQDVEGFFTAKEGVPTPYLKLNATKVGGTMTVHAKVRSTSLFKIEYFHGKNNLKPSDMTIGGDARHPAAAYSRFIPCLAEYMFLTLPSGWKCYIAEFDCYAYKSSGNMVHEASFTESGLIAFTPSNIGKSFRVYLTKLVDETEVIPSASELASIDPLTQLEYGTEATAHEDFVLPREIIPASCAIDSDNVIAIDSHYGFIGIVPQTGDSDASLPVLASSLDDLTKTHVSYITDNVADEVNRNTIRNESQDASIADHEARIKALESTSGSKVYAVQFVGVATTGTKLLSASGKEFDPENGVNDFASHMPFLNIYEVQEFALNSSGEKIMDVDGVTPLLAYFIHFPELWIQLVTVTNSNGDTVQTYYVSTSERAGYTHVPAFLWPKYEGAWNSDAHTWIGPFKGKAPASIIGYTSALSKMIYIQDVALGINQPTRLWSGCAGYAHAVHSILLMIMTGSRNGQARWRGICNCESQDVTGDYTNVTGNSLVIGSGRTPSLSGLTVGGWLNVNITGGYIYNRKITAITADSPSVGLTKIDFSGDPIPLTGANIRVSAYAFAPTGTTDSVVGDFGNAEGPSGKSRAKIFGSEYNWGHLGKPVAGLGVYQSYPDEETGPVNEAYAIPTDYSGAMPTSFGSLAATGAKMATGEGYAKTLSMANGALVIVTVNGGASSAAAYCDYYYIDKRTSVGTTAQREVLIGGGFGNGPDGGPFCLNCRSGWGGGVVGVGPFLPL